MSSSLSPNLPAAGISTRLLRLFAVSQRLPALLLCLLALAVLAGCGKRQSPADIAAAQGILLRGNGAEPQTLDPQFATGIPEANILGALYEGLVVPEPATLTPLPGAAQSWETSADGLTWTFRLRPDGRWSNGEPVRAGDFVFAYRRMLSPTLGAQNAQMLYVLQNAERYHRAELTDFAEVGVRAVDDHTLELTLTEPVPYFLGLIQHQAWYPLYRPALEQFGATDSRNGRWTHPGALVGNGAFVLDSWNVAEVLSVRKNPHYRAADSVALNGIRFYPIANLNTEERAFRAGQLHVTNGLPLSKVRRYREAASPALYSGPFFGSYYYVFNCEREPFTDPRVRRALSLVINREALSTHVLGAGQKPAASIIPPETANHTPHAAIRGTIEEARQLLAEAGYPGGRGFPQVSLLYNTSENHKLVAEAVQQMWQDTLGIRVGLINQDWKVYLNSRSTGNYDIARGGWIGDYNDPTTFLNLFAGNSGNNWTGWRDTEYDALLAQAAAEQDLEARAALLSRAEQRMLDSAPVVPLYYYVSSYLVSPAVQGWHANVLDQHPFTNLSLRTQADGTADAGAAATSMPDADRAGAAHASGDHAPAPDAASPPVADSASETIADASGANTAVQHAPAADREVQP